MKAQLMLERIGWSPESRLYKKYKGLLNLKGGPTPWVAEVLPGTKGYLWDRKYLKKNGNDYLESNSKGTRGVRAYFILESGKLYEAQRLTAWTKSERFFCKVDERGEIIEIDRQEVLSWLRKNR